MKLSAGPWRGVVWRIVAAALVASTLDVLVTLALVTVPLTVRSFALGAQVYGGLPPDAADRCEADPTRWAILAPGAEIWAYDPATNLSANPAAPPLGAWLRLRLLVDPEPARLLLFGPWGGEGILAQNRTGPCGMFLVRFEPASPNRGLRLNALAALLVSILGATLLTSFVAVRPLVARVARLAQAAGHVGRPGYRPLGEGEPDALGKLAALIDASHDRVREEAERQDREREALERHLGNVAHDLRTPLASLLLRLEEVADRSAPETRAALAPAFADIGYLTLLTENLHLAARLQADIPIAGGACELGEIVDRVAARFALLGERKGVGVEAARPDGPVRVPVPALLAEQVVANLVHNAVAHHDRAGHVDILLDRTPTAFRLAVIDDGPGAPPERLPRLAEASGARPEARSRASPGIGLVIVREVCARQGWKLTFESVEPRGLAAVVEGAVEGGGPDPARMSATSAHSA